MDRRRFLLTSLAGTFAAPLAAKAQQARKVWRLGFLAPGLPQDTTRSSVLMQTLQELGYVQNQSLVVERRFAEGRIERLPALAAELVQLKVDVIFTVTLRVLQAPDALHHEQWDFGGRDVAIDTYPVDGHVIWGATQRITRNLLAVLDAVR